MLLRSSTFFVLAPLFQAVLPPARQSPRANFLSLAMRARRLVRYWPTVVPRANNLRKWMKNLATAGAMICQQERAAACWFRSGCSMAWCSTNARRSVIHSAGQRQYDMDAEEGERLNRCKRPRRPSSTFGEIEAYSRSSKGPSRKLGRILPPD
jgi:hypothetical protein